MCLQVDAEPRNCATKMPVMILAGSKSTQIETTISARTGVCSWIRFIVLLLPFTASGVDVYFGWILGEDVL
jgi:hypothetical protein